MGVLDGLLEGFSAEAHPRDWHGRFRVGDMVRLKIKAADGMDVVGRIQRISEDGKKAIIAPARGGAHVEASPGDVAFHSPKSAVSAHDRAMAAEQRAREFGSSGVKVPSGVDDPNLARRRAAREKQVAGAKANRRLAARSKLTGGGVSEGVSLLLEGLDATERRDIRGRWEAGVGKVVHVATEMRYIGKPDSKAAKLEAKRVARLIEAFGAPPPVTPAQSDQMAARQVAAAKAQVAGWNAQKHPRAAGGKFGYTTGGKRATRASSTHPRTLQTGARGTLVAAIQRQLGLSASGSYDAHTTAAVTRFQRQHHLLVDGIVGRQTLAALRGQPAQAPGLIGSRQAPVVKPRARKVHAPVRIAGGQLV